MIAARMIPALWFRFIILIGFVMFMAWESLWILVIIGVALLALTGWQLLTAYKSRDQQRRDT